jgi:HPt (histidine-containing phosphotransfer) domain-containing protein
MQPVPDTLAPATPSPVDRSVLEVYSDGELAVELEILHDFAQANQEDMVALRQAASDASAEQLAWAAHRIKGASRMVGANEMGNAAEAVEKAAKAGQWHRRKPCWRSWKPHWRHSNTGCSNRTPPACEPATCCG